MSDNAPESVDQALAHGWIGGVRRSHDVTSYTIRFTSRKAKSTWSSVNIKRVAELTALGQMMAGGLAAFARRDPERSAIYGYEHKARGLDDGAETTRAARLKTLVTCSAKGLWVPLLRDAQPKKSKAAAGRTPATARPRGGRPPAPTQPRRPPRDSA